MSCSADRRRLLGAAMESYPSAHLFARLIRWSMVFGLQRPSSSLKSRRIRLSRKASMALSGEIFSVVFWRLIYREMYDLRFSPVLCMHSRNSSNDVGHHEVPRTFAINACQNSCQSEYSQEQDCSATLLRCPSSAVTVTGERYL
jgi:hypothetical protein